MLLKEISWTVITMLGLASFRLTRLIVFDKITSFLRAPFFNEIEETNEAGEIEIYLIPKEKGLKGWIGQLLSCYWCTGIWVSLFIGYVYTLELPIGEFFIIILAIAAIGSLIETIVLHLIG